jgi:hypothetical protein
MESLGNLNVTLNEETASYGEIMEFFSIPLPLNQVLLEGTILVNFVLLFQTVLEYIILDQYRALA